MFESRPFAVRAFEESLDQRDDHRVLLEVPLHDGASESGVQ